MTYYFSQLLNFLNHFFSSWICYSLLPIYLCYIILVEGVVAASINLARVITKRTMRVFDEGGGIPAFHTANKAFSPFG